MSTVIIKTECLICDEMQNVIDACPVEAIQVGAPHPFINDDCINCGACIDMCPYGAIEEVTGGKIIEES